MSLSRAHVVPALGFAMMGCVSLVPAESEPRNIALLLAGGTGSASDDVDSMRRHLEMLEHARRDLHPGAAGVVDIRQPSAVGTMAPTADLILAEIAKALLELRDHGDGREMLIYWSGPAFARPGSGETEILLGGEPSSDGEATCVSLETIEDLLSIAPDSNVLMIVNAVIDPGNAASGELREHYASEPRHCFWFTRPIGIQTEEDRNSSTAWWARLFREQLDLLPARDVGADGPWNELRTALDRALADNGQAGMPETIEEPAGLWWMWALEDSRTAAVSDAPSPAEPMSSLEAPAESPQIPVE